MVNIQSRESLAKHTRQSGEEQMIVDRYKYTEPNAEMSCRCRDGRRVTGEGDEEIAGHVGVAGSEMTGDGDETGRQKPDENKLEFRGISDRYF